MKTKSNFSQFFTLLKQMPNADKEELVWQHSKMKTTSLREFYETNPKGYFEMISSMQNAIGHNESEITRLRSAILLRLQKGGIDTSDWAHVNLYLSDKRIAGKPLYQLTITEMNKLIKKLEILLQKFQKRQSEIKRLELMN